MTTRRFLLGVPLALALLLIQSYFWVPTYEEQARATPDRLEKFISASIGDAGILNPILAADSASSEINNLVFEGLIDRDENLRLRGRVAESWEITEEAFFVVDPQGPEGPPEVLARLEAARRAPPSSPQLAAALANIRAAELLAPQRLAATRSLPEPSGSGKRAVQVEAQVPARIKLTLGRVDPDLFRRLAELFGERFFEGFRPERFVRTTPALTAEETAAIAAEILPATEHNPVIEFRLRPGVRFHDGEPVTAEDVRFTYDAIMYPANLSPRVADYEPVKRIEVLDPLRLRVVYKRLYSPAITAWSMGILPAHRLNAPALAAEAASAGEAPEGFGLRRSAFNRRPVGCGPFVFREWKSDRHIALERFEGYWEGAPNYRHYLFRVVPDLLTQEMEFYAGTVDAYGVQPHQASRLGADPRFQSFSGTSFSYTYIGFNLRRPPFDDLRVRRALAMAIDVDRLIAYVLHHQGERTTGPFPKQTAFYDPAVPAVPYDPAGAAALLAEAGWRPDAEGRLVRDGRRLQFTLITNSGNDTRKTILAIAQDAWKKLGIEVRTDLVEWSVFIKERVNRLDFDALVLGWTTGVDPDLFQVWHSSQTGPHQLNFVGYRSPEADRLIERIREEYDEERQIALCRRLHARIAADQPYVFLYVPRWTAVLDRRIVIRETGPDGDARYRPITPSRTGSYMFDFNRWVKLSSAPSFDR